MLLAFCISTLFHCQHCDSADLTEGNLLITANLFSSHSRHVLIEATPDSEIVQLIPVETPDSGTWENQAIITAGSNDIMMLINRRHTDQWYINHLNMESGNWNHHSVPAGSTGIEEHSHLCFTSKYIFYKKSGGGIVRIPLANPSTHQVILDGETFSHISYGNDRRLWLRNGKQFRGYDPDTLSLEREVNAQFDFRYPDDFTVHRDGKITLIAADTAPDNTHCYLIDTSGTLLSEARIAYGSRWLSTSSSQLGSDDSMLVHEGDSIQVAYYPDVRTDNSDYVLINGRDLNPNWRSASDVVACLVEFRRFKHITHWGTEENDSIAIDVTGETHISVASLGGNDSIQLYGTAHPNLYIEIHAGEDHDDVRIETNSRAYVHLSTGDDMFWTNSQKGMTIIGSWGEDRIVGGDGDDFIDAGDGADDIYGGAGNDICLGGDGDDLLIGEEGSDEIWGQDGNDICKGLSGKDTIHGGAGDDQMFGGDDNDDMRDSFGKNLFRGGNGNDFMVGGEDADRMFGEAGHDRMWGFAENDFMRGGSGNDILKGGDGDDILHGEAGVNILLGSRGNDSLFGGPSTDYLFGEQGNDKMNAGAGRSYLSGGAHNDNMRCSGSGAQYYFGGHGADTLIWTTNQSGVCHQVQHSQDILRPESTWREKGRVLSSEDFKSKIRSALDRLDQAGFGSPKL